MVAGAAISADLSDAEWLSELKRIGEENGTYSGLGKDFSALFIEQSQRVLLVSFETVFGIRTISETGLPIAFDICDRRDWSHLTLVAKGQSWYRDTKVYGFFDRLADLGFFDTFDRVIFYGAGMCGYAAGAFSVAAPGATVIMLAPQATLARNITHWDDRFPSTRRLDFNSRYAYAPDMIEAAEQAIVIFDPDEVEDSMHASLFRGSNVVLFKYRRGSAGAIEADLRAMSLVSRLADKAVAGPLELSDLARLMRARRRHVPYLRALLSRVLSEDRPELTAMLCRAVLKEQPLPRFKKQLEQAEEAIAKRSGATAGRRADGASSQEQLP